MTRDAGEYFELGEGEWIYISPRGKLHWPGCRYYKPMGPESTRVVFEIGPEFWNDACKFCDPDREHRTTGMRYGVPEAVARAGSAPWPHDGAATKGR